MRRIMLVVASLALAVPAAFSLGDPPAPPIIVADTSSTQPTTVPTTIDPAPINLAATQPAAELPADSPIRIWLANLASPDATVREQAQTQLMGISRAELYSLRLLIQKSALAPAQVAALHDIVTHAFLAGETYEPAQGLAFLGIRWLTPEVNFAPEPPRLGVPVEQRLIGFPSYQYLRTGDLILGVLLDPHAPLEQLPNMPTPTRELLIDAVSKATRVKTISLEILRQGQHLRVPIRLAPKPLELAGMDIGKVEQFLQERSQRAEEFWETNFVPLLKQNVS